MPRYNKSTSSTKTTAEVNEHIVKAKEIANTIDTSTTATNDDVTYARVDYENAFIPYRIGEYQDVMGLKLELYNHVMTSDQPIILIGDKGAGKTMSS